MAEKTKRYWKHTRLTIVDGGELLRTETDFTTKQESESAFFKTFNLEQDRIYKLKQLRTVFVLMEMLRKMDYNNMIEISYGSKIQICKKLGILKKDGTPSPSTFDKHPKILIDHGILFKINVGLYVVNPKAFGRGQWANIKKFREHIKTDENGKEYLDKDAII